MPRLPLVFAALAAFTLAAPAPCQNSLTRQERKEGFERLFDGKTLDHWHSIKFQPDAGPWQVRKGVLTWQRGGSWLATDETFYDFVLRLEYRTGPQSNSGIYLRAAPEGNPAFSGMELQILGVRSGATGPHITGSLYGAVAASKDMTKPDGEWNSVEVTLIKRDLTAVWNGERVLSVNLDDPQYARAEQRPLSARLPQGHIGLQAYPTGAPVEFRNIRIKVVKAGQRLK